MKEWTIKERYTHNFYFHLTLIYSVYSNLTIPKNWKTRLGYREELLKFIGDDQTFCNYLVKTNGGNTLDTLNNEKKNNTEHINNKENQNNTSHVNYTNTNQTYNIKKRTNKKNITDASSTSNSSELLRQVNFVKDPNESGQVSRRYTNLNITPMDIVTTFNEKVDVNQNYDQTPIKTSNNINANLIPISETKNKLDEDDVISHRRSISKRFGSPKKFNNQASQVISDKEKRTIIEHYRNLYSFKKVSPNKNTPSEIVNNKIYSFPLISQNQKPNQKKCNLSYNNENTAGNTNANSNREAIPYKTISNFSDNKNFEQDNFNATQKNSMFRSSIYSNLMPTGAQFFKKRNPTSINTKLSENEKEFSNSFYNLSKSKGKNKTPQTTYGPFLHIDNKFDKKIEIKNPDIRRSLEDINYYGPYFSHCPICRFKNLDFYQTMEPHQCLKLLSYIKMKRSKIQVK